MTRRFILACLLLLALVPFTLITGALLQANDQIAAHRIVLNPYDGVDWDKHERHHGSFHVHTRESDGKMAVEDVIDAHLAIDHRILAITDHDTFTWPWQKFDRDPKELGMIAVPGNELSRGDHMLSLFSDLVTQAGDNEARLKLIHDNRGLAVLAHPGRYAKAGSDGKAKPGTIADHAALYRKFPSLIGMEVINQTNRYPQDRALWDAVLTELMPERPVWGMANDDSHEAGHIGLNSTVLLLPAFDLASTRTALENGRFYFTTLNTHPRDQRDRVKTPVIRRVVSNPKAGTLTVHADPGTAEAAKPLGDDRFQWFSAGGTMIHEGPTLNLNTTKGISKYVRLEIRGDGGTAYTQPFGIASPDTPE